VSSPDSPILPAPATTTTVTSVAPGLTPKRLFRLLAIAEAITWTILITALIMRATLGLDWAVLVGGSIHGFVFLAYAFVALLVGVNQRWPIGLIALGVLFAIVPYATIPFELWLIRRGRLEGDWRRETTEHPSDGNWVNRMLRWFLARPVLLSVVAVLGIAAVFTVLLMIGPPGGREA
jgi:integral membrane protein